MPFIELQRSYLEELDAIEVAISKRLERNPNLIGRHFTDNEGEIIHTKKRPYEEEILQKHELGYLIEKYKSQNQKVLANVRYRKELLSQEAEELRDGKLDMENFDMKLAEIKRDNESEERDLVDDVNQIFSMYSSIDPEEVKRPKKNKIQAKRKHIVSRATAHIALETIFSPAEGNGRYLDLKEFHERYNILTAAATNYYEYLSVFQEVPYEKINRHTENYAKYVEDLAGYLQRFYWRQNPLMPELDIEKEVEAKFRANSEQKPDTEDGKVNENGEVFCAACNKVFAKETVFKAHLSGKKHQKNAKNTDSGGGHVTKPREVGTDFGEFKIHFFAEKLRETIENSKLDIQRRETLTERERLMEIEYDQSDYTTVSGSSENSSNSSSEDDDQDESYDFKNLPVGIDGRPIPYWLYKLQGYHKSYDCEICGNITYRGRNVFSKHFGNAKHQYGLKCLGIEDDSMPLFKNITRIDEAVALWRRLKKERRKKEDEAENAIEVEDEEGNAISEKDYLDLKKQGLL